MMPLYKFLIDGGYKLKILIYSGDNDAICSTIGTQEWIWDLGYPVLSPWKQWIMDDGGVQKRQASGYHVSFGQNTSSSYHFVTVHGAGHMVPATRPAQSLHVLRTYLSGK